MEKTKNKRSKQCPMSIVIQLDKLLYVVDKAIKKGLPMVALFPYTEKKKKSFRD